MKSFTPNTAGVGDSVITMVLTGHLFVQDRPFDCRYKCVCGSCNGTVTTSRGTVIEFIHWGDGAIDAKIADDQGKVSTFPVHAGNSDAC